MIDILPSTESIPNAVNHVQNITPPIDTAPTSTAFNGTPKKRNYLFWILAILALAAIFVTSFLVLTGKSKSVPSGSLAQPSDSEEQMAAVADIDISSWKTYTNANLGITLRYPSSWTVNTDGLNTKVTIKASQVDRSPGIEITSRDIQEYVLLSHWLAEIDKDCEEAKQLAEKTGGPTDCIDYKVLGERKINQYVLSKILWSCCGTGPTIRYFIESKNKIYFIDLFQDWEKFNLNTPGDYDEDGSALAITYQQILSTFKFLE